MRVGVEGLAKTIRLKREFGVMVDFFLLRVFFLLGFY